MKILGDKLDFQKLYKDLYLPPREPREVLVPEMNFLMVDGQGNPNNEGGEYQQAVALLYAIAYTIKMSKMGPVRLPDYVEYAVPPLEGLWWISGEDGMDYTKKDLYCWTSMIRQPEFVTEDVFQWAVSEVRRKKPELDVQKVRLQTFEEGLCVQMMHIGPYDSEPASIALMAAYMKEKGLRDDIEGLNPDGSVRRHHEIYLGDPRKSKPENRKTVLRHPVRREVSP